MHLPNMVILRKDYTLRAIMSRTGVNARAVATQYQAAYCTTDYEERYFKDDQVDLVMITTRHDLHGHMALQALRAGKHTFVEKPLTLKESGASGYRTVLRRQSGWPIADGLDLTGVSHQRYRPSVRYWRSAPRLSSLITV